MRRDRRGDHQGDQRVAIDDPLDRQVAGYQGGRGQGVSVPASHFHFLPERSTSLNEESTLIRERGVGLDDGVFVICSMIKESGLKIFPFGKFRVQFTERDARVADRDLDLAFDPRTDGLDEAAAKAVEAAR